MSSTMVSRDGTARQGGISVQRSSVNGSVRGSSRQNKPVGCNRCHKPLKNTIFLCSCDCVFCDECTFAHFEKNSNCPVCNRVLGESDLREMMVMDPMGKSDVNKNMQALFTKSSPRNESLSFQEMCQRLMKTQDEAKQSTKFLLKQLLLESNQLSHRMSKLMRANAALKDENSQLKGALNSQKVRYEEACTSMKQQLSVAKQKIDEKDLQLLKFRQLHGGNVPSIGGRSSSGASSNRLPQTHGYQHSQQQPSQNANAQPHVAPPLRGFMKKKMANERARQQELEQPQRQLIIKPGGSSVVGGGQSQNVLHHQQTSGDASYTGSHSSRYSSGSMGSGGRVNKRRRNLSPSNRFSNGNAYMAQTTSPSAAFLQRSQRNGSGGQGPAPFFQQHSNCGS